MDRAWRPGTDVRVLVVSDIRIYREGLTFALGRKPGIRVLGAAAAADKVIARLPELAAEVVLVDVSMPDSLDLIGRMAALAPHAGVVALGLMETEVDVLSYVEAGISGYLPPDGSLADLVEIIGSVARSEFLCSPQIAATLIRRVQSLGGRPESTAMAALSRREREIAGCLAEGLSNKAIARRLAIRPATVKNHVHRVLDKLQVRGRAEVAARLWGSGRRSRAADLPTSSS